MASSRKSNSADLADRVAARIGRMLPEHSSILVGLSGGVDSVVLLHVLHTLAPRFFWQLSALHVHHGISPNADVWAVFCADLCLRYQIPLHVEHVDLAPLREHGIEAAARKLRHAAFSRQSCDFVAVAHHADDQVETLFLQLLRGAGLRGASAMPVLSQAGLPLFGERANSSRLLRPLLSCSRHEIIEYAATHHLQWIEDESNLDESYPRNFLRHRVLPVLDDKFPSYRDNLARSAQHFAEAGMLLDELAQQDASGCMADDTLAVAALQALSQPRAKNLLRYFLHSLAAPMPQAGQLEVMLQQLCGARQDARVCIAYGDWQVRRYQGRVHVLRAPDEFTPSLVLPWLGEVGLDWPAMNARLCFTEVDGAGISVAKLQLAPVTVRFRRGGEALRLQPQAATRTLKNLLQEHRVPPWQRDRLPLIYSGENLVCVPGVAVGAEYQADGHEPAIRVELEGAQTGKA